MAVASVPSNTSKALTMSIKRTFIELVPEPASALRSRSCTDSELLLQDDDVRLLDISDASTETPSEEDADANPVEWQSPYWGPAGDLYYAQTNELDSFALPASSMPWPEEEWYQAQFVQPVFPAEWFSTHAYGTDAMWNFNEGVPVTSVDACAPVEMSSASSKPCLPKTTIMLRNLPNKYTRADVVRLLEDEGFEGSFDLVYAPMDFNNDCCLGYAFVNMLTESDAIRGWNVFSGFRQWGGQCDNVCEVVWSNPQQGSEALIERYRNSPVMHPSMPDEWKPAYFVDGELVPFPAPTQAIKAPKQKQSRRRTN